MSGETDSQGSVRARLVVSEKARKKPEVTVGGIAFDERGRTLLIQRGQPPAEGRWSIPGGRIEFGEVDNVSTRIRHNERVRGFDRPEVVDMPAEVKRCVLEDIACLGHDHGRDRPRRPG